MKLGSIRKEYRFSALAESGINPAPFKQFSVWLDEAINAELEYATAFTLATIGVNGFPQSRIVLLKGFDQNGFTFFTNYNSAKGKAILENNRVGLHFFWPEFERQIRITGFAEKTKKSISDKYFKSRPPESQLAAIISDQSKTISSREYLEKRYSELKNSLKDSLPERPKNWGGYVVKPIEFEFWQGRENRLHDRIVFYAENGKWEIKRLAP